AQPSTRAAQARRDGAGGYLSRAIRLGARGRGRDRGRPGPPRRATRPRARIASAAWIVFRPLMPSRDRIRVWALPAALLARVVAAYVGFAAGLPGKDSGALATAGQPKTSNRTATEQNGTLNIPADPSGALAFQYGKATANAGSVTLEMPNKASITHDISVK